MDKDNNSTLTETVKAELSAFVKGTIQDLSKTAKLFLTLSYGASRKDAGFLIDGTLLRDLDRISIRKIFNAADDNPIIVVYRSVPRRLVLPPRFQLLSRSPEGFSLICNAHEFIEKRENIIEMMQSQPASSPSLVTDSESPDGIII